MSAPVLQYASGTATSFRLVKVWAKVVYLFAGAAIVMELLRAWSFAVKIGWLQQNMGSIQIVPDWQFNGLDVRQRVLAIMLLSISVLYAVAFVIWVYRAASNLETMTAEPLTFHPGW